MRLEKRGVHLTDIFLIIVKLWKGGNLTRKGSKYPENLTLVSRGLLDCGVWMFPEICSVYKARLRTPLRLSVALIDYELILNILSFQLKEGLR